MGLTTDLTAEEKYSEHKKGNKIEIKQQDESMKQRDGLFFKKTCKNGKLLARLFKKKRELKQNKK